MLKNSSWITPTLSTVDPGSTADVDMSNYGSSNYFEIWDTRY